MTSVKIEMKSQRCYTNCQLNSSCHLTNIKIYIKTWVKDYLQCIKWTPKQICGSALLFCTFGYVHNLSEYCKLIIFPLLFHISMDYVFTS